MELLPRHPPPYCTQDQSQRGQAHIRFRYTELRPIIPAQPRHRPGFLNVCRHPLCEPVHGAHYLTALFCAADVSYSGPRPYNMLPVEHAQLAANSLWVDSFRSIRVYASDSERHSFFYFALLFVSCLTHRVFFHLLTVSTLSILVQCTPAGCATLQ